MSSTDSPSGPIESRRIRTLFYLAEGTMAGALLVFATILVFRALRTSFSGRFSATGLLVLSFIIVVGSAIALRNLSAHLSIASSRTTPRVYREWKRVRRWTHVALVALSVATILLSVTVLGLNWDFVWYGNYLSLLALATIAFGLVLRMLLRHLISSEDGQMFPSGTRRGLIGFLVLLGGVVVVLMWGGVPVGAIVIALVGIGGYALLYLLAAAELE